MGTKADKVREQNEAVERLRAVLKPGDRVWCVMRHRSASGMTRYLDLVLFRDDPHYGITKYWLTYNVARALGRRFVERPVTMSHETIEVGGCGFDAGHEVVTHLAQTLFGSPDALKMDWV